MFKPLITVILPIYNVEKYLEECLDSLLNQTIGYEKLEVIMVNDHSTDNTAEIIDRYANQYSNFKAIHLETNCGSPGKPRNIGIELAQGKYTIFLDPDDIVPEDAYELLYNTAEETGSDFVMGKMISFNDTTGKTFSHITFKDHKMLKSFYSVNIDEFPFFLQVKTAITLKLVKTDFLIKHNIRFIENLRNAEDKYYDVLLLSKAEKFSYIPKIVYRYRARTDEDNLSLTQSDMLSSINNEVYSASLIKEKIPPKHFQYFQINIFRSVFWKLVSEEFEELTNEQKIQLVKMIAPIIKGYDKRLAEKYMPAEEPILSLIDKEYIAEAINYILLLHSRKSLFNQAQDLKRVYNRQRKIKKSTSWRITKILRSKKNNVIKRLIKRCLFNGNKLSRTTR